MKRRKEAAMIKTLQRLLKQDQERYIVPRKVQDVIPIKRIWNDGIFLVGNKYAKTYKFTDINYMVASREDKESMFLTYSELINSLDSGATSKITINNHRINQHDFESSILMPMRSDGLDEYRDEYNQMLIDKATGANGITQEKYITITVKKKDVEEARIYFARIGADLISHFNALGSKCAELTATERLRILHDFYRYGEESSFTFNAKQMAKWGHDFKDYICPDAIEKNSDYLKLGDKYCRVIFLKDYASYIKDSMVSELKLMNYIRYWQASGESLKTSIRTKTRLSQLTEEGHYTGGTVPFGYRAVDKGRINKRNRTVFDLEVDEDEAEIVRLIFDKYVNEGFGSQRICRYLHDHGIKHRDGKGFPNTSLNRIIKNIAYIGVIKNGESQSAYIDELRIISDEVYQQAQEIMRQRTQPHSSVPLNSKGKSLLVGNIYCAHCGNRLTLTTSGRNKRLTDGTIQKEVRARYQCHYNVRHPGECDGQSGYSVPKLDSIVESVIRMKFDEIAAAPESEILTNQHEKEIRLAKMQLDKAKAYLQEKEKDLEDYKGETLKVIRGQSKLSIELLNSLTAEANEQIRDARANAEKTEKHYSELLESAENLRKEYDRLLTWADLYDKSTFEAKKMIAAQFIKAVRVGRDYNIEIDFNVSFEEFQSFCNAESADENLTPLRSRTA
jgi:hypothetical protein